MVDYIYIGKIVGTHGIKGEIRLISNFDKKDLVFKKGMNIYIGENKEKQTIFSYRKHKNYDMIVMEGFSDINEVLPYKGSKVYVLRGDILSSNDYVLDDLIGMRIISDNQDYGVVKDIFDNNGNILLEISFEKKYYIPYNDIYIKHVDINNKCIEVLNAKDLIL